MKKSLAVLALLMCTTPAYAEVSSTVTLVSDFVWRGVTQDGNKAAVQGSFDYAHDLGFSGGVWVSTSSHAANGGFGTEVDVYANYSHAFNDMFGVSVGIVEYAFTQAPNANTAEINLGFNVSIVNFSLNYTDDYFACDTSSTYFNVNSGYEVWPAEKLSVNASVGMTMFDDEDNAGMKDYIDYKIGISKEVEGFTTDLSYSDTNRVAWDGATETDLRDQAFIFSVSKSF